MQLSGSVQGCGVCEAIHRVCSKAAGLILSTAATNNPVENKPGRAELERHVFLNICLLCVNK